MNKRQAHSLLRQLSRTISGVMEGTLIPIRSCSRCVHCIGMHRECFVRPWNANLKNWPFSRTKCTCFMHVPPPRFPRMMDDLRNGRINYQVQLNKDQEGRI